MDSGSVSAWLVSALLVVAASVCLAEAAFTTDQKKEFVMIHNRLRQTAVPHAAAMNFVIWSCKLEALAQKAASKCVPDSHINKKEHPEYANLGENICNLVGTEEANPTKITMGWFSEKNNLVDMYHESQNCKKDKECNHYTQVMNAAVTEIGCGISKCSDPKFNRLVFCEYNSPQAGGVLVFAPGPQCSECSKEMPFCLNGLCISKALAEGPLVKDVDSKATAASLACQLACKDCGTRDTSSGGCKCTCGTGDSTGGTCDAKTAGSAAKCSLCRETPPCLNGGTEDKTDTAKCKCTCTTGFVGDRCEIAKDIFANSVKLVIGSKDEFVMKMDPGTYAVFPPVSRSLFNSKLWTNLQTELANAVNGYCRTSKANFEKCCTGKTFPGDSKVASAAHVSASDVKFSESSVANTFDGSLNLFVHAEDSVSSALCATGAATAATVARRKRATATKYVPQAVLLQAIKANVDAISGRLTSCCDNAVLKQSENAAFSVPVAGIRKGTILSAVPAVSDGTYECAGGPASKSTTTKPNAGSQLGSPLMWWQLAPLLLLAFAFQELP